MLRTIPITTGEQPKFTTRSGIKVIIEKYDAKRMDSETIGIPNDSPDGYNIDNVQWAMRVTYSGEFVHAAPWSVGSQGYANVSHGCTGMSTANADWLYHMTCAATSSTTPAPTAAWSPPTASATGTSRGTSTSRAQRSADRMGSESLAAG